MDHIENTIIAQSTPPVDPIVLLAKPPFTMAAGRYPKRARTQIDYAELDKEASEGECEEYGDEFPPPSKVRESVLCGSDNED